MIQWHHETHQKRNVCWYQLYMKLHALFGYFWLPYLTPTESTGRLQRSLNRLICKVKWYVRSWSLSCLGIMYLWHYRVMASWRKQEQMYLLRNVSKGKVLRMVSRARVTRFIVGVLFSLNHIGLFITRKPCKCSSNYHTSIPVTSLY